MLIKTPVPAPLFVFVGKAIVGLGLVFQTTPLAVIEAPPSLEIVPPLEALFVPMALVAVVVTVGRVVGLDVLRVRRFE